MAGVDTIGKGAYITNQNYSGVKIDIHNPVVNVPQQETTVQKTEPVKIYKYTETQIPPEYYPQMIKNQPALPPKTVIVKELPRPKTADKLPESVIEKVTVPVPPASYIEESEPAPNKNQNTAPVQDKNEQEPAKPAEDTVIKPSNTPPEGINIEDLKTYAAPPSEPVNTIPAPEISNTNNNTVVNKIADPEENINRQLSKVEIVPPGDTSPVIDYIKIVENLDSPNYDVQALQLKEIVDAGLSGKPEAIKPYLIEPVFHSVIDIVSKDTTTLAGPTDSQNQIRSMIAENLVAHEKQKQENVPDDKIVLPHNISEQDINYANTLSPLELAERNKEYGIATLALLSKAFVNRVQKDTGSVVPVTDVPGLSAIVNSLKSDNYKIRLNALDALIYLQREEYARELTPIYEALINTDTNETVRAAANFALNSLNAKKLPEQQVQTAAA